MRIRRSALAFVLVPLLLLPSTAGALAGAAHGSAVLVGACGIIATDVLVTLALTRDAAGGWDALVTWDGPGCGTGAHRCDVKGTLPQGLQLVGCTAGGEGSLGPVVVCVGGPQREPLVAKARADFDYHWTHVHLGGTLNLVLVGDAVTEANPCV